MSPSFRSIAASTPGRSVASRAVLTALIWHFAHFDRLAGQSRVSLRFRRPVISPGHRSRPSDESNQKENDVFHGNSGERKESGVCSTGIFTDRTTTDKVLKIRQRLKSLSAATVLKALRPFVSSMSAGACVRWSLAPFNSSAPFRHEPSAQTERSCGHIRTNCERMLPKRNLGFAGDS